MAIGDAKIELRCALADVAELEEPNQSYRLAPIDDPEAGDVRSREVHRGDVAGCQPASTVKGPLVVAEELDELVVVVRDLDPSELDWHPLTLRPACASETPMRGPEVAAAI
jgi:hypothetical protein